MPTVSVERLFRSSKTLHRTTQELSMQAAELAAALTRDDIARFQQAVAAPHRVRVSAIGVFAFSVGFLRAGNLAATAVAALITTAYVAISLRIGGQVRR